MPFKELEHTADVLMRVWGDSLEELFAESARALSQTVYGKVKWGGLERSFSLDAEDLETLLHDFLSELIFLSEVEGIVISSVEVELNGTALNAKVKGEPFDPSTHYGGTEVKGISFFGLQIIKDKDRYVVDILFDV